MPRGYSQKKVLKKNTFSKNKNGNINPKYFLKNVLVNTYHIIWMVYKNEAWNVMFFIHQ